MPSILPHDLYPLCIKKDRGNGNENTHIVYFVVIETSVA